MTRAEYLQAQSDMMLIARLARELPLDAFLQRNAQARGAGPVQDPKFWPGEQEDAFVALQKDYALGTALKMMVEKLDEAKL